MRFHQYISSFNGFLKESDDTTLSEIDITNTTDLPEPKYIKKWNGYLFTVDDTEFIFRGYHINNNEWRIKFGVHTGGGQLSVDMSEEYELKKSILILKNVVKCIDLFTKQYKPNQLRLSADRRSRQLTYERIIGQLLKKPEWKYYAFPDKIQSDTDKSIEYVINKQGYIKEGVLDNVLSLGSKFLYFWKNKWIINTAHGLDRIIQRNKLSVEDLKRLFKEAIEKALELGVQTGEEILFWSKSLKQGFVSAIDPQGNIKLITFLPKGKHQPKTGTEHVVVEDKQIRIIEID